MESHAKYRMGVTNPETGEQTIIHLTVQEIILGGLRPFKGWNYAILGQYTGFKDAANTELYEGDRIVNTSGEFFPEKKTRREHFRDSGADGVSIGYKDVPTDQDLVAQIYWDAMKGAWYCRVIVDDREHMFPLPGRPLAADASGITLPLRKV